MEFKQFITRIAERGVQAVAGASAAFPDTFLFGAGNSDCQCESFEAAYADIRDLWYERTHRTARGRATDFWNRFHEDVGLAQGLGCKIFRFSIAWARVEPTAGTWNQDALDHYSEIVDAIRAAGMEPLVTLVHFVWPIHIEERGGLIAPEFPNRFAAYTSQVVQRIGARVKYWITFNEPNILLFGYLKAWWERDYLQPPGLPPGASLEEQNQAQIKLIRNLFLAHTSGRSVIRSASPQALVGANPSLLGLPNWLQTWIDRNVINLSFPAQMKRVNAGLAARKFVESGKVDVVVAGLTQSASREREINFAYTYFLAHQRLLVAAASPIRNLSDLAGKSVAVVKTTTAAAGIYRLLPTSVRAEAPSHTDALQLLNTGKVSAFLADDAYLLPLVKANPGSYRILDGVLTNEPYAPAVAQGNLRLLHDVDQAVREFIDSGRWAQSYLENFGAPVPVPPSYPSMGNLADVNKNQPALKAPPGDRDGLLDRIRKRGRIRIGVRNDRPGMGFQDPAGGKWTGLEIDIAKAIARRVFGTEEALELVPVRTAQRITFLHSILRFLNPFLKIVALITTIGTTNWWNLGMSGKLQPFLCPPECVGQLDFVGLDYYWGLSSLGIGRIERLVRALAGGQMEEAPVYPSALYNWLKETGRAFPNFPIIIVENGCVESADGISRADYLRLHLEQVQKALSEGVKVAAYLSWSITTNRELGLPAQPNTDFGLFHIELDKDPALIRTPTPAAAMYESIVKTRSIPKA